MKAAILGTTGYTGMVLLRLISGHPEITSILPISSSTAGSPISAVDPGFALAETEKFGETGGKLLTVDQARALKPDVVFAALPHLKSAEICAPFFGSSIVIDLSADFRITDTAIFEQAYGRKPPRPDLLEKAAFGLCEVYEKEIRSADLIANPGCYPTCSLLPLVPLTEAGMIEGKVIINALSGISGAGKKVKENLIFCKRTENTNAYGPGKSHRHCQEIQQEIDRAVLRGTDPGTAGPKSGESGLNLDAMFTPHLVPVKRGMAVTTAVSLSAGTTETDLRQALRNAYADRPFVQFLETGIPETADVWGSNRCDIGMHTEGDTLFLFSVIDNLMKGASGQAVQNMNIRFGFPEAAGLPLFGAV